MDADTANALARGLLGGLMLIALTFFIGLVRKFLAWLISLFKGK